MKTILFLSSAATNTTWVDVANNAVMGLVFVIIIALFFYFLTKLE